MDYKQTETFLLTLPKVTLSIQWGADRVFKVGGKMFAAMGDYGKGPVTLFRQQKSPAVVKKLHDAFKKAYDDPKVTELYHKFDFVRRYLNTEDYGKFVLKLAADEKAALEKLGLAKKD